MINPSINPPITYYALDLEELELERTLAEISKSEIGNKLNGKVVTKGMWGTYDDGLKFIQSGGLLSTTRSSRSLTPSKFDNRDISPASIPSSDSTNGETTDSEIPSPSTLDEEIPPLHILFLGSSLGNFNRIEQANFLRSLPLRPGSGDTLLLGLDHDNDKEVIENAYNDPKGYTKKFIMNGLKAAGKVLGNDSMFDEEKWEYVNVGLR